MSSSSASASGSDHERVLIDSARRQALDEECVARCGRWVGLAWDSSDERPASFCDYEVIREIGRGGQGVVYEAIQTGTGRSVAIKLLREGRLSGAIERARFDREVHVLAHVKHPNIVAIHECGRAAGSHYFVMDYVAGPTLDEFVRSNALSVDETLKLFATICDAVNAAHLHGVIHRDLKPSNIRVDADGQPQILDFGLAKTMSDAGGMGSVEDMTVAGQFVGSLPWSSPEQASGAWKRVDLRTDVYSLGMVLYEMLTGRAPYRVHGPVRDVLNNILDVPPERPSKFRKGIDEEAETIVLKCLAKDAALRYQDAGWISEDIRRYLHHEPILARAPSASYHLRKLIMRHKFSAALVVTVSLLTIVVAVWMTVLYGTAESNLVRAMTAEAEAQADAETAREVSEFLVGLFELSNPSEARANTVTAREILDRGADRIRTELVGQPRVQGKLMSTMGRVYTNLSLYDEADGLLGEAMAIQRRLGDEDPLAWADTLMANSWLRIQRGDPQAAEVLMREALELRRAELGDGDWRTAQGLRNLGLILQLQGRSDDAEHLYRKALKVFYDTLGSEHKDIATCMVNLAQVLRQKGDYASAESLARAALAMTGKLQGYDSPSYAQVLNNLAGALRDDQRYEEAEPLYRESIRILRNVLSDSHTDLPYPLIGLGKVLLGLGRAEEAELLVSEALAIRVSAFSENDYRTGDARNALGQCLAAMGRHAEAERELLAAYTVILDRRGSEHPSTRQALADLNELYESSGGGG